MCWYLFCKKSRLSKNYLSFEKALICDGLVSQHPPRIVAPASWNFFANSAILSGVKSLRWPKNSFGFPVVLFLKELITIKVLISLIAVCVGIYFVRKADFQKTI